MGNQSIENSIRKVLIKVLNHENFVMSDDLVASQVEGWDSLSHMTIIAELESEFNIKFKLKELNKMRNVKYLVDLIKEKIA